VEKSKVVKAGDFVVSRESLRVSGTVEEVFREAWTPQPETGSRLLTKLPPTLPGTGRVICAVRLRRPVNVLEGFDVLPSGFTPVLEDDDPNTDLVFGPIEKLETLPDFGG
jgi:hypothetical protein